MKKEFVMASELARTIESLDGIRGVRVQLNLADRSPLSKNPQAPTRAAIVIQCDESKNLNQEEIKHLASASISGLNPSEVKLFLTPVSKPDKKTVRIGPIEVVQSSASMAKICLGGLLVLCIFLALGLVAAGIKLRKIKSMR